MNDTTLAIRERIAEICEQESPVKGEIEVDESYFGSRRIKGLRGRAGASGKLPVVGLKDKARYTEVIDDCSKPLSKG